MFSFSGPAAYVLETPASIFDRWPKFFYLLKRLFTIIGVARRTAVNVFFMLIVVRNLFNSRLRHID